ncbi:unnamed protein product [Closterium sp. NIES-54]
MHEVSNLITDGDGGAKVVAGRKAPTVIAQTERRDRKVVAAVKALASQPSQRGFVADGMSDHLNPPSFPFPLHLPSAAFPYASSPFPHRPEGSGKSLLLHMLAGRLEGDPNFRGSIEFSGEPFGATLRREIGFVENDVDLQANLTVRIHRLGDLTVIGRTGRNAVLYNELRRLAIGVQMIVNPPLLLLDEPTSGWVMRGLLHCYAVTLGLDGGSVLATGVQMWGVCWPSECR